MKWPKWARVCFFGVLTAFWILKAVFSFQHGPFPYLHTDGQSELVAIHGARHFVTDGFFKNYLLPTYPPFGHAPGGKPRTEDFVYTHYLAGPELTMGLVLKAFGVNAVPLARLVPHTFSVFAMGWLTIEFATLMNSAWMGIVFLGLLFVPRSLINWTICLHGHAYAMAIFLCLAAGMIRIYNQFKAGKKVKAWAPWVLGALVGFGQMFYELDWIPLSWIFAMSLTVLWRDFPRKLGAQVCLAMLGGGILAGIYQLTLTSLYFGSLSYTIHNLAEWLQYRSGAQVVEGFTFNAGQSLDDLKLHKLLHFYNLQAYGATNFTALNLLFMGLAFIVMGYAGRAKTKIESWHLFGGLVLAYLASIAWNVGMRQHSLIHVHFLPRHYFALYLSFELIALQVAYALVMRSRRA